jgi:hypothetical protein
MAKGAPSGVQDARSGKKEKRTAYLIAVRQKREALRVYAVVAPTAQAALELISALATEGMEVELVGGLSRDMVRRLGLKPGEMQLV